MILQGKHGCIWWNNDLNFITYMLISPSWFTQFEKRIKMFRAESGGEYNFQKFQNFLATPQGTQLSSIVQLHHNKMVWLKANKRMS